MQAAHRLTTVLFQLLMISRVILPGPVPFWSRLEWRRWPCRTGSLSLSRVSWGGAESHPTFSGTRMGPSPTEPLWVSIHHYYWNSIHKSSVFQKVDSLAYIIEWTGLYTHGIYRLACPVLEVTIATKLSLTCCHWGRLCNSGWLFH